MSQPTLDQKTASPQRQLELLEALLRLPAGDMKATLEHVGNLIAGVFDTPQHPVLVQVQEGDRTQVPADHSRLRQCLRVFDRYVTSLQ